LRPARHDYSFFLFRTRCEAHSSNRTAISARQAFIISSRSYFLTAVVPKLSVLVSHAQEHHSQGAFVVIAALSVR
jgi:hypothetical protein